MVEEIKKSLKLWDKYGWRRGRLARSRGKPIGGPDSAGNLGGVNQSRGSRKRYQ